MSSNRKFLLLCAFVVGAVAVPVSNREQCARHCTEEGDFPLRPGSTYTYDYEMTTTTAVQGSSQDKTNIQMTAHVDVEVVSKCDLSLRLRGVTMKLSDPENPDYLNAIRGARDFAKSIERHVLRFSFQNGKIEHVCPTEDIPVWVLNIQKGILSAFQTQIVQKDWSTKTIETDILGKCTAEYQSLGSSWQGTHTVRKLKDLTTCTDRENIDTYLQGTPYTQDFHTKSLPLVKGTQECEQVLGQGFFQTSTCREKLVFRPFSNGGSSVITSVFQKLSYVTISQRTFTGNDYRPTTESLLYRHAKPEEDLSKRMVEAEKALKDLCDASQQDISMTVPRKFSAFVYKLKNLELDYLRRFFQRVNQICPSNTKARKFFMDAIPLVATTNSAKFMYDMISRNEISDAESNFWLTSLSFINEPTSDIIAAFIPLLDGQREQALFGISALIHTFCKSNDCAQVPEVQAAVMKMFANLGDNCFSPDDKKIMITLKALGNIGIMFGKESTLEACYKNPQIRTEARLAAIQAFRRVSCDVSRDDLMQVYSTYYEDPEIRIASYLSVMTCPSADVVTAVKNVLMKEKINHVGSFIWTHLNALAKSKHPQRQDIRDVVSNLYLLNKYHSDVRKFSTAREATFFLESIDSGFHADSHLIFSTDSYLPRTAMFNLTVDVFGKTCNLFQIDGRMEGLEHVVESFFGPSGYFPQKNIAKVLREKRSVSNNKIEEMDKNFQAKSRFQQTPYGSLDVKIFGTTLWYNQFKQLENGSPDINLLEVVTQLAEEHEAEYSRSFMFLDTTFTVPMTSGLPLRIAVNGTASVGLKYGGKFDVKSFEHVDVLGHIEPSGAIEIASLLTVDAGNAARSGLRVVGTMHSSTVLDGRLEIKNGEVVKAQLNMPRDRIDIFNIQSKLYLVHGAEEREQKVDKKSEINLKTCTGRRITKLFGVQLCSELRLPPYKPNTALHPVNGPANFNIYIQKTDPNLKSYVLDAEWKLEMKNGAFVRHAVLSMNTPESQVDRDIKMELYVSHADHTATFKIKTPVKRLGANAKLINDEELKKLVFEVTMDDKDYFSIQSELRSIVDKSSITYMPSLEIRLPSRRLAAVSGSAYMKYGQKYTAQLQIEDLTDKPILAKGNVEVNKKGRYDGELSINSYAIDGTMKGYVQTGDSMASRITAEYKFLEGKMNKINVMGKMRNLSANALTKYNGLLSIQASLLPEWNTELSFDTMKTAGHTENTISISLGDGVRSRVHTIRLQEILKYEGTLKNNKVDGSLSLVYPEKNIDYALQVNHENTENSLKNTLKIQYDTNQNLITEVQLALNQNTPFSVTGDVKVKYPGQEAALSGSLTETNPKEYTAAISGQYQGKQAGIVVNYKDKTDASRIKYEVEGEMNLPLKSPITFSSTVGFYRGQYSGFTEVNIGMDKYRVRADYGKGNGLTHTASGQIVLNNKMYGFEGRLEGTENKLSCKAEVKLPNRHRITAKFEGRKDDFLKVGNFETLWDADRDTSKRFGINGELRSHADGYESKIIIQVLRRTINALLSTNMRGKFLGPQWNTNNKIELEWSPSEKATFAVSSNVLLDRSRQQVNSQFEITTPYTNYENLSLSLTHMFANQQWESEISTLLPQKNQIILSSSGKYSFVRGGSTIEMKGRLQTSFLNSQDTYFELSHDHSPKELTSKAQLRWGPRKQLTFDISGVSQPSVYRGSMKFTSPFRNFEDLSTEVIHNYSPDNYKTRCEFQWAPRRKVSINVEGTHVLNGRRRICTVAITTSSPFRDFENTAAKLTYSNDGRTLNGDLELNWSQRKKITSSFIGSLRNSPYSKHIESKLQFTTPFKNYENFQVSTLMETNRNAYKFNVDAQLPHRSTASINSQGKFTSLNDVEINAVVIGDLPRYMQPQRASIDFVHKFENSKLRSTLDTAHNSKRFTVLLVGLSEFGFKSSNIELSAALNTPFTGYEEVKCDFIHNQRGHEYTTKIEGNKNKLSGSLIHKLSIRDALNFESTLDVASSEMPNAKISVIQLFNEGQFEHNSYVTWDKNKRINLNAQYLDKSVMKEFTLKFTTPFRNFRELETKASYENQSWDHKAALSVIVDRRNKITLSGDFRNYRWKNVNTQMEFTSTLSGHEFYSATFKYDLTAPQKSVEISYLWDIVNRKSVTVKGNVLHSYSLTNAELEIATPYANFNQISFSTKLENSPPERNLNIVFEKDSRKTVLNGRAFIERNNAQINVEFTSPYDTVKNVKCIAKYNILEQGMSGELSTEWNRVNKYLVKGEYKLGNRAAEGKLSLLTPFEGYKTIDIQTNVNYGNSRKVAEVSVKWDNDKTILVTSEYNSRRDSRGLNINIQTSFENYREISFTTWYKSVPALYEGEVKATINREAIYKGNIAVTSGGEHLMEIKMNINSPYSQLENLRLTAFVDSEDDLKQLTSSLVLNDKESNFNAFYRKQGNQFYEVNVKLNTPYQNFKLFTFESSLRRNNFEFGDVRVKMETPFEVLRTMEAYCEIKFDDSGHVFTFSVTTPQQKISMEGVLSNKQFRPFTANFEVDAPFLSFKKLSTNVELNLIRWDNAKLSISVSSPRFKHGINAHFIREEDDLDLQFKVESPAIPSRIIIFSLKEDYVTADNIESEASLQIFGNVHYLTAQYSNSGRTSQIQFQAESPLLKERKAGLTATLSKRRSNKSIKMFDGKLSFFVPSWSHDINVKYENKGSQIVTNLKIDSSVLNIEAEGKYTNSNNRDVEAAFTVSTPKMSHSIVGSLKNYEGEKFVQIKIECPLAELLNAFSITGTLKHDNYDTMDGSLSITGKGKELRLAGNMKNDRWKNVEAFITLNTPFDVLQMFRIDGRFNNDNYKNIDCNFQIETSNRNLPSLGMTSKISRTKGSEEISLMFHLPLRNYKTIQLLANAHYEADFSSADSRITLTIAPKKYSISGQYGINYPRISGTAELEYNRKKWVAAGRLESTTEKKDASLSITTPDSERYNFGGAYGKSENRYFIAGSYVNPFNEKYDINTSMSFNDYKNFETLLRLETPFDNYRNIEAMINQQYNTNYISTNAEYVKNGRRGFLKFLQRNARNSVTGSVQIECPDTKLNDLKISYNHMKKPRDEEYGLEMDLRRIKQFKVSHMRTAGQVSLILDIPVLPMTITAHNKELSNGRELQFKSNYNSRVMGFRTSFQKEARQIQHDASLSWDEKAEKTISYDFKLTETSSNKELWGRLDLPVRSFMLKGNFTNTNRVRSGGIDFYWDVSRSLEKHMAVGIEHSDMSSQTESSHKVEVVVKHPKLTRDIIQTNLLTVGRKEFKLRSELFYSSQRHHHMIMEVKANDLSRNRDSHYKGEFLLRHPTTRLDIRANGEFMNSKLESSFNAKLNTVDKRQVQHVYEMKGMLSKLMQQAEVMLRSDENVKNVLLSAINKNGEFAVIFEVRRNEMKEISALLKYVSKNNLLEITVANAENKGLHASASLNKESAKLEVAHGTTGSHVTDIKFYLGLEQSKILRSQLNWRPKMWRELRIATGENLRAFLQTVRSGYSSASATISEELKDRLSMLSRSMYDQVSPFANEISNDFSEIIRDLGSAKAGFLKMYKNNEFYMKVIVQGIEEFTEFLRDFMGGLALGFDVLCNIINEYAEDLYDRAYYGYLDFLEYMQKWYGNTLKKISLTYASMKKLLQRYAAYYANRIEDCFLYVSKQYEKLKQNIIQRLDKLVRAYAPYIIDGYYYIWNAADSLRYSAYRIYSNICHFIETNRYFIALKNYFFSVSDTIQAFRDYEYAEAAQAFFSRIYDSELIDNIINHPNVEYMSELANSALRKSVQIYHNVGLDILVASVYETMTNYAKEVVLNAAQELLSDIYEMKGGLKYDFAPKRGYLAFEMNLPTPQNSLIDVFNYKNYPEYQKMMNMKNKLSVEFYEDFCVWDFYYKFLKYFSPGYWLPAFTAHAMIAGNQHYITFDKHSFDYAGKCSYLLTRDFVDGNFSVIVNYGNDHTRKSLTVLTEEHKIDIGHDYKITLDDTKVESPLQIGKTVVIREGANIRIENEKKGFHVLCNFVHNYCLVSISGFYYAKTGGLFGTFNYEPNLDMMTPSRYLANDLESFASSWEVGQGGCRNSANMATVPGNDLRVLERCKSLFLKSSSEFRACFKQVDPEPYLRMCVNDLSAVQEKRFNEVICETAAAYFMQCKLEGVPLKMPSHCVRCEKQDGSMLKEGEALQFTRGDVATVADVVFLIEEKECNKERVKYLPKVAQTFEENFRQKGYREVRFSVVGFGGDGIHAPPHVHTMDGQESGSSRSLESALESLKYGNGPINILEALRYAASLNFRPGTTKSFVLMKCSTCKSEEVKAEYSEMLRTLIDGDIPLHLLMEQKYEMKSPTKNSNARKVLGVDKNFAYTLKDVKDHELSGDGDLLAQLKIPKDVCIPLALEAHGSSFDVQFLTDTKKNVNKKFMDVFARRVVKSRSRNESQWGMCCECIATVDGIGKSTCQRCVSAEIANMISAETSGINNIPRNRRDKDVPKKTRVRKHPQ